MLGGAFDAPPPYRHRVNRTTINREFMGDILGLMRDYNYLASNCLEVFLSLGSPVSEARVIVDSINKTMVTTPRGEYWRLLSPGNYKLMAESKDGTSRSRQKSVTVTDGGKVQIVHFVLKSKHSKHRVIQVGSSHPAF